MKKIFYTLYCCSLLIIISSLACKKIKNGTAVEQLPPETQEGKGTFGCLVNGSLFVPKGSGISPILSCYYQHSNTANNKGYFFQIDASNNSENCNLRGIRVFTDSLPIHESDLIILKSKIKGGATGDYSTYSVSCGGGINSYYTTNIVTGQLFIKKLDEIKHIVSGTFWFTAVNATGDTVKITDGRFDMKYTL